MFTLFIILCKNMQYFIKFLSTSYECRLHGPICSFDYLFLQKNYSQFTDFHLRPTNNLLVTKSYPTNANIICDVYDRTLCCFVFFIICVYYRSALFVIGYVNLQCNTGSTSVLCFP